MPQPSMLIVFNASMLILSTIMNRSVSDIDIAFTVLNGVSVLVCLLAVILLLAQNLQNSFAYRLSLYQLLSSLSFAIVETLQIIFINYGENSQAYGRACTFIGFLGIYSRWAKLLFTFWVAFHLFCFAVLRKSVERLEALYVLTSLIVPAVFAVVPLTTGTYRLSGFHSYCFIYGSNNSYQIQLTEWLLLWDVPAMIILLLSSVAMAVVITQALKHLCRKLRYESITGKDPFWRVFKQLLPLAAFPILFLVFMLPAVIFHIYSTANAQGGIDGALIISAAVFISLWSLASGGTVIVHIALARFSARKIKINPQVYSELRLASTVAGDFD